MVLWTPWWRLGYRTMKAKSRHREKRPVVLVFGEDNNDREAIAHLVRAIRTDAPDIKPVRKPVILRMDIKPETRKSLANQISKSVAAHSVVSRVVAVVAHRDCDRVEPISKAHSDDLLSTLSAEGIRQAVAVTPAFEIEAWWYLWPEAVAAVRPCWTSIAHRKGQDTGRIENAKETLRRDLHRSSSENCPKYRESDSATIANKIKQMNCISRYNAHSESFLRFYQSITALKF
jgi:hypothetical protein